MNHNRKQKSNSSKNMKEKAPKSPKCAIETAETPCETAEEARETPEEAREMAENPSETFLLLFPGVGEGQVVVNCINKINL